MSSTGKKLINSPTCVVDDCLEGLVAVNPGLRLLDGHRVVVRADLPESKVTLVSGGGAGHEPAHAGYVGPGMLSGAVSGAVFTSPPPGSILATIKAVNNEKGTLVIIKNYTGDRLNFGMAAERAKAAGHKVDMVFVAEDCALASADKTAGRRGLAGTVFIHKIAGAMAEEGKSLEEITAFVKDTVLNMGTMSVSLSPCSVPGSSGPSFSLPADEMELGLGIHGEAGVKRTKLASAKETVDAMLKHMTNKESGTHFDLKKGASVALMVNNLGGTSVLELHIVAKEAIAWLELQGVAVDRVYCGTYMTSLEMAGVSLTIMNLNDARKKYLDAPAGAPGWSKPLYAPGEKDRVTPGKVAAPNVKSPLAISSAAADSKAKTIAADKVPLVEAAVRALCEALMQNEELLNKLDTDSGDGDCGATHKRAAESILAALGASKLVLQCPSRLLLGLAAVLEQDMGGSSGAIYSLFLTAAARPLAEGTEAPGWCEGLGSGLQAIMKYGGATPGDRTMVDAFSGAHNAFKAALDAGASPLQALEKAVQGAESSAAETAKMAAHAGRASYVSADHLKNPDPGAQAVAIWMRAVYDVIAAAAK